MFDMPKFGKSSVEHSSTHFPTFYPNIPFVLFVPARVHFHVENPKITNFNVNRIFSLFNKGIFGKN
jgi:hypothetical protein